MTPVTERGETLWGNRCVRVKSQGQRNRTGSLTGSFVIGAFKP